MDKVVHFEIPSDDIERTKKFYSDTFGWETQTIPDMNYTMLTTVSADENNMPKESGAINGGMYKRDAGFSKSPVVVIGVASIEDALKKVQANGGKVVKDRIQFGNMGLYAQVSDTEDNIIGLWQDLSGHQ
ncbi:MAG: VOC family protein [Nitrospiria bacterium]